VTPAADGWVGLVVREVSREDPLRTKRERLRVLELLPSGVARCVDGAQRIHWLPAERLRAVKR
jgi:hypothetical protein